MIIIRLCIIFVLLPSLLFLNAFALEKQKEILFEATIVSQVLTDDEYWIKTSDGNEWYADNAGRASWVGEGVKVAKKWGWKVGDNIGFSEGETFSVYIATNFSKKKSTTRLMLLGSLPDYSED